MLLSLATLTAYSQIGVGIKAGANFSNIDIEDISTDSKTGFHFGAFVNVHLNETWAIQPELLYSTIGAEVDGTDDIDFDYLQIPLLLQGNFSILNIYAGPQLGLITNKGLPGGFDDDNIKDTEWSFILGAGVDLPLGLEAGGRYVYGITDISDIPDLGSVNNHVWQLYVAWRLFGGR